MPSGAGLDLGRAGSTSSGSSPAGSLPAQIPQLWVLVSARVAVFANALVQGIICLNSSIQGHQGVSD